MSHMWSEYGYQPTHSMCQKLLEVAAFMEDSDGNALPTALPLHFVFFRILLIFPLFSIQIAVLRVLAGWYDPSSGSGEVRVRLDHGMLNRIMTVRVSPLLLSSLLLKLSYQVAAADRDVQLAKTAAQVWIHSVEK